MLAAGFAWISRSSVHTTYLETVGQMLVSGCGLGLATAPATEAIMGVVSKEKAGVGSAVNDPTRELGGTPRLPVIGRTFSPPYTHALTTPRAAAVIPADLPTRSKQSIGAALLGPRELAKTNLRAASLLTQSAQHAFFNGFKVGCVLAAAIALVGGAFVTVFLPAHPTVPLETELAQLVTAAEAEVPETR